MAAVVVVVVVVVVVDVVNNNVVDGVRTGKCRRHVIVCTLYGNVQARPVGASSGAMIGPSICMQPFHTVAPTLAGLGVLLRNNIITGGTRIEQSWNNWNNSNCNN